MQPHASKGQRTLFDMGCTKRKCEEGDELAHIVGVSLRLHDCHDRYCIPAIAPEEFVGFTATAPSRGRRARGRGWGSGTMEQAAAQSQGSRGRGGLAGTSGPMVVSEDTA
eukprot:scaffold20621_cov17-Tisochrysis_lutea.AAC.1